MEGTPAGRKGRGGRASLGPQGVASEPRVPAPLQEEKRGARDKECHLGVPSAGAQTPEAHLYGNGIFFFSHVRLSQALSVCQRDEAWTFLHTTRMPSYFLRSEGHDMKHIFQIFGLLGFPRNPI